MEEGLYIETISEVRVVLTVPILSMQGMRFNPQLAYLLKVLLYIRSCRRLLLHAVPISMPYLCCLSIVVVQHGPLSGHVYLPPIPPHPYQRTTHTYHGQPSLPYRNQRMGCGCAPQNGSLLGARWFTAGKRESHHGSSSYLGFLVFIGRGAMIYCTYRCRSLFSLSFMLINNIAKSYPSSHRMIPDNAR